MAKTIVVKQIGSPIRRPAKQRQTLIGLGLNKMHKTRELEDTPAVRGMVQKSGEVVIDMRGVLAGVAAQERGALVRVERRQIHILNVPLARGLGEAAMADEQQPTTLRMQRRQPLDRRQRQTIGIVDNHEQILSRQCGEDRLGPAGVVAVIQPELVDGRSGDVVVDTSAQPDLGCAVIEQLEQTAREAGLAGAGRRAQVDHITGIAHQMQQQLQALGACRRLEIRWDVIRLRHCSTSCAGPADRSPH